MQKPTKMPKQARTGAIAGEIILVLTTGETATYVLGSIPTLKQGKVKWLCGNPPTEDSVYPKTAAYQRKAGLPFASFRSDELGAIRTVKQLLSFPIRSIRQVISTQPVLIFPITPQLIR